MVMQRLRIPMFIVFLIFSPGCTTNVPNTALQTKLNEEQDYSFENWLNSHTGSTDESIVVMSFSGGGSRAAALAASVLTTLKKEHLENKIAVISSTSGGSVTAGFYAAAGIEGMSDFREDFLRKNNTLSLGMRFIPGFFYGSNRSLQFSDYLDEILLNNIAIKHFKNINITYASLISKWPNAPFIILNATDASTGATFEITQQYFSYLCSNLAEFKLSQAIAASSSFPFLMTPIPLKNYWDNDKCRNDVQPYDYYYNKKSKENKFNNLDAFIRARYIESLRNTFVTDPDSEDYPYRKINFIHLIDGGLSDNLAARALLRSFNPNVLKKLRDKNLKRILLIQVNAKSEDVRPMDLSSSSPSIGEIFKTVAINPLDVTTTLSSYISKEYWVSMVRYVNTSSAKLSGANDTIAFFPVQVDFDQMSNDTADDRLKQKKMKSIGTDWKIDDDDLNDIEKIGENLLLSHPCFVAFKEFYSSLPNHNDLAKGCEAVEVTTKPGMDHMAKAPEYVPEENLAAAGPPPPPAPMPEPIAAEPPPVLFVPPPPPARFEKVTLSATELFAFGSSHLKVGQPKLDDIARALNGAKEFNDVFIIGYSDNIGSAINNSLLSKRRAESVKSYLIGKGVPASRLIAAGKGEQDPVVNCKEKNIDARIKCLAPNRRVEIEQIVLERRVQ